MSLGLWDIKTYNQFSPSANNHIMKRISLLWALACVLSACNGQQSDAKKLKADIQATMKAHTPGTIATSATGYYMKAKIDGKDWVAVSMMPIEGIDRVVGYIGIPDIKKTRQQGFKVTLGEAYSADLYIKDDKTLIDKDGNAILLDQQD